jgi:hypothetical protein
MAGVFTTFTSGLPPEVHIEAPQPIGVAYDMEPQPFDDGHGSGFLGIEGMEAGEYVIVMGWATNGIAEPGSAALYGSEGTQLISKRTSDGGFVRRDRDFRGLNVSTGAAGSGPVTVRPLVMARAAAEASVEDSLYGWFAGVFEGVSLLSVEKPDGAESGSDLIFLGSPAGRYVFRADLVVAPADFIYVWGVDAARAP